jgi:ComF family protein
MINWLESLLDLIFPSRPFCPLCGRFGAALQVCDDCLQKMAAYRQGACCFSCGRPAIRKIASGWLNTTENKDSRILCSECAKSHRYFTLARSAGPYQNGLRDAIHRFKYGRKRFLARPLGAILAKVAKELLAVGDKTAWGGVAGLVPVPLARKRIEERGFNQAELLAQKAGELIGLPVLPVLKKIRETPSQTGLSREQRKQNLEGAFEYCAGKAIFPAGCLVIIIDDVFTTGCTISECARVLLKAGAREVYAATLARTVYQGETSKRQFT